MVGAGRPKAGGDVRLPPGQPDTDRTLSLHIDEERGVATALRYRLFALLHGFAGFLAILAANRERQGPQPALGDLLAALETVADVPSSRRRSASSILCSISAFI